MNNSYYNSDSLMSAVDLNDETLSRYESLLSDFDECLEEETQRIKEANQQREQKVTYLANAYGKFLDVDFRTPRGQKWLNDTIMLYSKNEDLYNSLLHIVESTGILECSNAA